MSQSDTAHAWWSRLRHQGLLLSPVVMIERYPSAPPPASWYAKERLRNAYTRFATTLGDGDERDQAAVLGLVDALMENFIGHPPSRLTKQHSIPEKMTVALRIGSRSETLRPHRILYADDKAETPALLVMADSSPHVGRGRGRTAYARCLELLRGTGCRLGLLTNGQQFRLIYAGLDFESWCEWESERWFDDGEGTEELCGLWQLLAPEAVENVTVGVSALLSAVEESRKRQADLSSVLRENVRQAVELILEEVSTANRVQPDLFTPLVRHTDDRNLTDSEAHEALLQATVRLVMRLVVCLFAESRQLLPLNDPIYASSYGVRSLYELLDEAARHEGGTYVLFNRQTAWPRLMALCRLIHGGSSHGAFPLRPYGGALFRPGDDTSSDPVSRALHILEHNVTVGDATIYHVLRKLLRGPLPVLRGRSKTYVEGPVDYTDLRTEFIGLIYEGLLDYRLKRTDEQIGPQVFLNLGREPVLPLSRLTDMLANDKKGLKDLLATLRKEKVSASAAEDTEEGEEETEDQKEETAEEEVVEVEAAADEIERTGDYLDSVEATKSWAREAVVLAKIVPKQRKKQTDAEYQTVIETNANKLVKRVVSTGEFYLVRAGNTRKGTGTFYTRPQLAVPTVHRTLEPLCYDKGKDGTLVPKTPEAILGLKVCDPACGSASFLVAALHYLTDALYRSLCHHRKFDDPAQSNKLTLPLGRPRTNTEADQLVPFPPDDPQRGDTFKERITALLRRHVVERCIYGVDINPLAVEFARVSLWVETLDPELPFSFLDHKVKVGNSLVGCWLDRVEDYPLKAWEREGGDGKKGDRTQRIETFLKGEFVGKRRTGDGRIKREMREVIRLLADRAAGQKVSLPGLDISVERVAKQARAEYEKLHDLPVTDPDQRECYYREHVENSPTLRILKAAMDEWCVIWFWPTDEESLKHVPTPLTFHKPNTAKDAIVEQVTHAHRFFHWELEFPDVFSSERSGFDGVLGNPPWEVMKPASQEFFTEYDPLYRTYDKQTALRHQRQMFEHMIGAQNHWDEYNASFKAWSNWVKNAANPFDLALERGNRQKELASAWAKARSSRTGFAAGERPFSFQGSADLNSYKLFLEVTHHLLASGGRMGLIVPSGLYTDAGCHDLRELFLTRSMWDWLFGFINWEQIFSIYYRFKFVVTIAERRATPQGHAIRSCFGRYKLRDWEQAESVVFPLPKSNVLEFSPKTLSILEITNQRDLDICRKIYANSFRIGDNAPGWEIKYACEFHMTNDSKHFKPREWWESKGYKPDVFGRWVGPDGDVALPLYEGRMIGQFDFSQKGHVSGRGRTAKWREIGFDQKTIEPQFLVAKDTVDNWPKSVRSGKLAFMDVASATNARSFIGSYLKDFPANHKTPVLSIDDGSLAETLLATAVLNSLSFDYAIRSRLGGLSLGWFILEECPVPKAFPEKVRTVVLRNVMRLALTHRLFAPEWLFLKENCVTVDEREWKDWWAVTEPDRVRLRVETDALVADLYNLEADDFDWMLHDDPSNPTGFHRVDKQLPFRERLTGLAAAAFRALKEGKWSAASAADLSNDEFFDLLGIPELTNADAAKTKGESGPLILKRDGCHVWKPENFPADDPRHGWTWDHCWQDVVTLLGSEDAVREYIEPKQETETHDEPAVKRGRQGRLF